MIPSLFDKELKRVMPKRKVRHSKRVARKFKDSDESLIYAALFHDYLERGGDIGFLRKHLPERAFSLIEHMTNEEGGSVIAHIKNTIGRIDDEELKNFLILLKIADRKDNYNKRLKKGKLTKKYKKKTKNLISFLLTNYTGDVSLLNTLL